MLRRIRESLVVLLPVIAAFVIAVADARRWM
jgi:hypothetical protein